ncbi:hypothetical protein XELAEV_18009063mg [Xenopus laevis]|uniref:Uncharacterized protein n=1 Tax=Xenopus laevis TaxID=8355 RepID=A0A974DRX8_XENLA|nr:hypothetical protein XELAEV_18009063mg [Xenopus laevis]
MISKHPQGAVEHFEAIPCISIYTTRNSGTSLIQHTPSTTQICLLLSLRQLPTPPRDNLFFFLSVRNHSVLQLVPICLPKRVLL